MATDPLLDPRRSESNASQVVDLLAVPRDFVDAEDGGALSSYGERKRLDDAHVWRPYDGDVPGDPRSSARVVCGIPPADLCWLAVFCVTGVGLGMSYEFLDLHSKDHTPAGDLTFLLCLVGYWSQTLVGCGYALALGPKRVLKGAWTREVAACLAASAFLDGAAQALDYVGQVNGGYLLFTIFHASVTVFSCAFAVLLLKAKVTGPQWVGVVLIVLGVFITTIPSPLKVTGNFAMGLMCSMAGSFCLAASYPLSELVFRLGEDEDLGPVSEEMACVVGSLLNTFAFTVWTLCYTLPRWDQDVNHFTKPGNGDAKVLGFVLYGFMVGVHSLSFWKSIHKLGTVPTAVAKGAQQAGIFACSHVFFCGLDETECLDYNYGHSLWNRLQKTVAFACCCGGVVVYGLNKETKPPPQQQLQQHAPRPRPHLASSGAGGGGGEGSGEEGGGRGFFAAPAQKGFMAAAR